MGVGRPRARFPSRMCARRCGARAAVCTVRRVSAVQVRRNRGSGETPCDRRGMWCSLCALELAWSAPMTCHGNLDAPSQPLQDDITLI